MVVYARGSAHRSCHATDCLVSVETASEDLREAYASFWVQRAVTPLVVSFFVWVNVSFLMKSGPVDRLEIFVLIVANAEALFLLIVLLLVKLMKLILDKRNERWQKVADRLEKLEKLGSVSTGPTAERTLFRRNELA